jgi:hypothetical protein
LAHEKFKKAKTAKPLEILQLDCGKTADALWGIASYCSDHHQLPFNTLMLDLRDYSSPEEELLPSLKQVLLPPIIK